MFRMIKYVLIVNSSECYEFTAPNTHTVLNLKMEIFKHFHFTILEEQSVSNNNDLMGHLGLFDFDMRTKLLFLFTTKPISITYTSDIYNALESSKFFNLWNKKYSANEFDFIRDKYPKSLFPLTTKPISITRTSDIFNVVQNSKLFNVWNKKYFAYGFDLIRERLNTSIAKNRLMKKTNSEISKNLLFQCSDLWNYFESATLIKPYLYPNAARANSRCDSWHIDYLIKESKNDHDLRDLLVDLSKLISKLWLICPIQNAQSYEEFRHQCVKGNCKGVVTTKIKKKVTPDILFAAAYVFFSTSELKYNILRQSINLSLLKPYYLASRIILKINNLLDDSFLSQSLIDTENTPETREDSNFDWIVCEDLSSRTKSSLLSSSIGKILSSCQLIGKSVLTDLFLLVAHDWILSDILNLNIDAGSSIVENPISKCLDEFSSFILDCIVCKSSLESQYIMVAANFIYLELSPFIERIKMVSDKDEFEKKNFGAYISSCITYYLKEIVKCCVKHKTGKSHDDKEIMNTLKNFFQELLKMFVYYIGNQSLFLELVKVLLCILLLPPNLYVIILKEINIDKYWKAFNSFQK